MVSRGRFAPRSKAEGIPEERNSQVGRGSVRKGASSSIWREGARGGGGTEAGLVECYIITGRPGQGETVPRLQVRQLQSPQVGVHGRAGAAPGEGSLHFSLFQGGKHIRYSTGLLHGHRNIATRLCCVPLSRVPAVEIKPKPDDNPNWTSNAAASLPNLTT